MRSDLRAAAGGRPGPGAHWESWSRNGEVCITGLDPPFAGGARLASCLTWLLRSFASHCRRTHDATKALAFTCTSPSMPSALAMSIAMSFDLALRDPKLIHARLARRGGDGAARRWPMLWLEASVYEYVIGRDPFPPVGTPRRKILLLAEERQVFVPAHATPRAAAGVRRAWVRGLDAVAGVDAVSLSGLVEQDEHAFAVNMLMLVHAWPAGTVRPRPSLEQSYRRDKDLIAALTPATTAKDISIAWHALWRLPPAMTWSEPGHDAWMRYPAVSLAAAVRPLRSAEAT